MPVADEKNEPLRKSTLQLNLGGRSPSNRNLNMLGSRLNLAGSKFNLAQQQDPQALLQAAMESGQRIYENNYQLKPAKKYRILRGNLKRLIFISVQISIGSCATID